MNTTRYPGKKAFIMNLTGNFYADKLYPSRFRPYRSGFSLCEKTWDTMIEFLPSCYVDTVVIFVGDGLQYQSHPEIGLPGAWTPEKLKEKLSAIRQLGMTPVPMLDFGCARDAWLGEAAYTVGTREYRQLACDLIQELVELFDTPEYFHLGFGDESLEKQKNKQMCRARRGQAWATDVKELCDKVSACGSTPWLWADNYGADPELFCQAVPKTALLSSQLYFNLRKDAQGVFTTKDCRDALELYRLGYTLMPAACCTDTYAGNETKNAWLIRDDLPAAKGFLEANVIPTEADNLYELMNAAYMLKKAMNVAFDTEVAQ